MNLFHTPFTMAVSGNSKSGKTHFVCRLLTENRKLLSNPPELIFYHYCQYNPCFEDLQSFVNFREGLPNIEELLSLKQRILLVLDDFMLNKEADSVMTEISTKIGHHQGISLIWYTIVLSVYVYIKIYKACFFVFPG